MLCAAGLSQHDPLLATLFRVERVCGPAMEQFYQVVDLDGASRELLAGIAARQRWDNKPLGYRQQATNPRHEKAMMGQLQIFKDTEFRRFPDDSAQLCIPALRLESGGESHSPSIALLREHVCNHVWFIALTTNTM